MTWRLAKSLTALRTQIDAAYPARSKSSDGSIGDASHSARTSDHNPNAAGVVCAIDITNDPAHGLVSRTVAQALLDSRDSRIKYVISNREIASGAAGPSTWKWRPYTGPSPHDKHFHISVVSASKLYDSTALWDLSALAAVPVTVEPAPDAPHAVDPDPMLRQGVKGDNVVRLQKLLNARGAKLHLDGDFGAKTKAAVIKFQKTNKLVADGIVGAYTWEALKAVSP